MEAALKRSKKLMEGEIGDCYRQLQCSPVTVTCGVRRPGKGFVLFRFSVYTHLHVFMLREQKNNQARKVAGEGSFSGGRRRPLGGADERGLVMQ